MGRKDKINSIRNWLKSCKQEAELGKKLSSDTFNKIISEFDSFIAFENEVHKNAIEHLNRLKEKVSKVIEDIITTESNRYDNRDTATGKKA